MNEPAGTDSGSSARTSARLKLAGRIILITGTLSAGAVYWLASRAQADADNPMLAGYAKVQDRQMDIMYGKMGSAFQDLITDWERPGALAVIVLALAIILALVCFRLAQPPLPPDDHPPKTTL